MKFGQPSRPTYTEAQLMSVAWAIVLAAAAFYGGLIWIAMNRGVVGTMSESVAMLTIAGWASFLFLVAWQAYRLEKTVWLWIALTLLLSPFIQAVACWKMFFDTRRWCKVMKKSSSKELQALEGAA